MHITSFFNQVRTHIPGGGTGVHITGTREKRNRARSAQFWPVKSTRKHKTKEATSSSDPIREGALSPTPQRADSLTPCVFAISTPGAGSFTTRRRCGVIVASLCLPGALVSFSSAWLWGGQSAKGSGSRTKAVTMGDPARIHHPPHPTPPTPQPITHPPTAQAHVHEKAKEQDATLPPGQDQLSFLCLIVSSHDAHPRQPPQQHAAAHQSEKTAAEDAAPAGPAHAPPFGAARRGCLGLYAAARPFGPAPGIGPQEQQRRRVRRVWFG